MAKFLSNINLEAANDIQFKTTAGANAGKIEQDGDNLVLSNAVGDILLGDGASDIYIGDGTNNVDIIFEQSGAIKGDGSAVTLTLGGSNTTLNLENHNINGSLSIGATTINNKLTFTTANGFILFDYEPSGDTGEYTNEVPLIKVGLGTGESTILARMSEYRAVALGAGAYAWANSGSDPKVTPPEGGGGGNGGGGSNNNNTSNDNKVVKPKHKKMPGTPGVSVIDGVRRDTPVGRDYSTPTVSNSLSSTLAAQNEADKMTRAKGKQDRKDMKLASRQKRRANRRANPTLVGGALRKTFGGKMFNSNINNMGSQRRGPGYENKA